MHVRLKSESPFVYLKKKEEKVWILDVFLCWPGAEPQGKHSRVYEVVLEQGLVNVQFKKCMNIFI